ncbi:MAG: aminoglycoside nucleotidyltransferase [Anaerolineae bacterium]|nr:aminoglycoside nucleotidyltransferase [Anaerolineae bacterium]
MMNAEEVLDLHRLCVVNQITVHIDGGWGIDALLGRQTRPHNDLDIAIQHKDSELLRTLLAERGYKPVLDDDTKDYNFVLADESGHRVDVHTYTFDANGDHVYGIAYSRESLTGTGTINGQTVPCIALAWVIRFHENYPPDDDDLKDVRALVGKFGVNPPRNYQGLL